MLSADHLAPHPFMHCGHKGLFFDRLDVGVAETAVPGASAEETPRLVPFAHSIYHNRNRAYNPQFGRFMQMDPNATALTLLEAASYNGRGVAALVTAFDMGDRYGDGANLYEYLGSSPWGRNDPMGLSWDPFDMVDDILGDHVSSGAGALSALGNGVKSALVLAAHIATYLPFPGLSIAGELALVVMGEQDMATAMIAIGIGLIPGGKLLGKAIGKLGKILGPLSSKLWASAKHFASTSVAKVLWRMTPFGMMQAAAKWIVRACGCFEAGTEVWTARGLIPINQVCEGDEVFAQDEATGEVSLRRVVRAFIRTAAPIVAVTLIGTATPASADTKAALGEEQAGLVVLNTTEEHPFLVESGQWVQAARLKAGDEVQTAAGDCAVVVSVQFTGRRATVYNIEVEGLHNYRVGPSGILVHNAGDVA